MHGGRMAIQTKQPLPLCLCWRRKKPRCFPLCVALAHPSPPPTSNIQHPVTDLPTPSPPCPASPLSPFSPLLQPSSLLSPPPPLPPTLLAPATASSMLLSLQAATCEFSTIELSMRTPRFNRRAFSTLCIHLNHTDIGNLQHRHSVYLH